MGIRVNIEDVIKDIEQALDENQADMTEEDFAEAKRDFAEVQRDLWDGAGLSTNMRAYSGGTPPAGSNNTDVPPSRWAPSSIAPEAVREARRRRNRGLLDRIREVLDEPLPETDSTRFVPLNQRGWSLLKAAAADSPILLRAIEDIESAR